MKRLRGGLAGLLLCAGGALAAEPAQSLDPLPRAGVWRGVASDEVGATLIETDDGVALQYDFHHRAGYAGAERSLPIDWPANFDLEIALAGELGGNDLEVKFVDDSGENVWWARRRAFSAPAGGVLRLHRRELSFAWGPAADRTLRHTARLQLVVNGVRGGSGSLAIGALKLVPRELPPAVPLAALACDGADAVPLPDGIAAHDWRCEPGRAPCTLTLDWRERREFGALRLQWAAGLRPARYTLDGSADGALWRVLRAVEAAGEGADWLWTPAAEYRFLRLTVPAGAARLTRLDADPPETGEEQNRLIARVAAERPRGAFPRGTTEQGYWTLLGVDNGAHSALLSEDGALETDVGGPSVEPFVVEDGRVVTWAGVRTSQSLAGGYLPMPSVERRAPNWRLWVDAFADADDGGRLYARYRLTNTSNVPRRLRLLLALRPFQVNGPAQFLAVTGGVAPLPHLDWDGQSLHAGPITVTARPRPVSVGLYGFERQEVPEALATAPAQPAAIRQQWTDPAALGSGVLGYDLRLAPGASRAVEILVPWGATAVAPLTAGQLGRAEARVRARWRARLNAVTLAAPDSVEATALAAALRSAHAHLLMSRQDDLLRPGTRSYARSWIRDGAMMSAALLRLGERRAPEDYLRRYATALFDNGKVPCCLDARGSDPVPEHDSGGEFLYLAGEVLRLTPDRARVEAVWPQVRAAVGYLDLLRAQTRDATVAGAGAYRGLLPPSISHEGYSAKPMHSYWDDFWGLRGYTDAIDIAATLGHDAERDRWRLARAQFAADVAASIAREMHERGLSFVPGAAELGDFDATSTTIALAPGTGGDDLPRAALEGTFERYWQEFSARRDGTRAWQVYTPYEWRLVGAFVRLGQRERALATLAWLFADRRPLNWNQWPEVSDREPRRTRFLGDLPHGWVASDFMRSVLDLYAYEDETAQALVLGAGLKASWLDGRGLRVRGLVTRYGTLGYRVRRVAGGLEVELLSGPRPPPGGFLLRLPGVPTDGTALINGRSHPFHDSTLRVIAAPARIYLPLSP